MPAFLKTYFNILTAKLFRLTSSGDDDDDDVDELGLTAYQIARSLG